MSLIDTIRAAASSAAAPPASRRTRAKARAEGDEPKDEEEETGAGVEEDEDPDAEGDDEEEKASAEGEEDEDPDAEEDDEDRKEARATERKRIKAILSSPHAAAHPALAAHLAFETGMTVPAAVAALKSAGAGKRPGGFASTMAGRGNPALGSGAGGGKTMTADDRLVDLARRQAEARRSRRRA